LDSGDVSDEVRFCYNSTSFATKSLVKLYGEVSGDVSGEVFIDVFDEIDFAIIAQFFFYDFSGESPVRSPAKSAFFFHFVDEYYFLL
jgi:hypothetical protein